MTVLEVEEVALKGDGLSGEKTTNDFERLVGSRAAFLERHAEAVELFVLEANSDAELETTAGDHIDYCDILGQAYGIVKRHQKHARCDADPFGARGDRCGYRQNRGEVAVFDEVVLREPNVVESVVLAPRDLIEGLGVESVRRTGATAMGFGNRTKDQSVFFDYPESWTLPLL